MLPLKTTDKLLTIDDEKEVRQQIAEYMEDGGFEMVEASSGAQGLEIFKREKPDLVIIDLQMPGMSGQEVLDVLTKESPQTPTVVMSDMEHMADIIESLKRGATDYVLKPVTDMTVLEHAVAKALERSRLMEQNRLYREQLEIANQNLKKSLDILEQDQEAGRSVQMRMLPEQEVNFGPYIFTHGVDPSLYLSGDFVDYFKINDQQFGFYIADVSGHGASSAFVTVLLKSLISLSLTRYQIRQDRTILEPDKLLTMVGNEIHTAKLGKYLTIVYGVVNWETHEFCYSIGGHYPIPILVEEGKSRFIEGKGFPVGIMRNAKYQTHTIHLPEKFQLILFSDGITEIMTAPDLSSKEKLLLELTQDHEASIEHFRKRLGLNEKKDLPDDVTMLILKRG